MSKPLTNSQRSALNFLDRAEYRTPAEIGWALPRDKGRPALKAQGAGRVGSSMAVRLMKLGFASNAAWKRNGHPAYSITPAGRAALQEAGR